MKYIPHIPLVLFCVFFLKVTFLPISYPEVLTLLILGAAASFFEFKNNDKKIIALEEKFNEIKGTFEEKSKQLEEMRTMFNAMKLSTFTKAIGK